MFSSLKKKKIKMTYRQAKKLRNEDEVIIKATGKVLRVVQIELSRQGHDVFIYCDDGNCYHHTAVN